MRVAAVSDSSQEAAGWWMSRSGGRIAHRESPCRSIQPTPFRVQLVDGKQKSSLSRQPRCAAVRDQPDGLQETSDAGLSPASSVGADAVLPWYKV